MNTHHFIRGIIRDNAGVFDLLCGVTHPRDSADSVLFTVVWKMSITKLQYRSSGFIKTHGLVCAQNSNAEIVFKLSGLGKYRTSRTSSVGRSREWTSRKFGIYTAMHIVHSV